MSIEAFKSIMNNITEAAQNLLDKHGNVICAKYALRLNAEKAQEKFPGVDLEIAEAFVQCVASEIDRLHKEKPSHQSREATV